MTPVIININSKDVGLTQLATVYLNDTPIVSFLTATKHEERSIEVATNVLAHVLADLITINAHAEGISIRDIDYGSGDDWVT